jgi:phosphatidate phosphatase APP1
MLRALGAALPNALLPLASRLGPNHKQQESYKQDKLRILFKTYPKRVFLLFGDSGEKDPEIYRQIASEFPGRVKGIFINNVTGGKQTDARFQGVQLTHDASEAAAILQKAGLLSAEDVAKVKQAL